MDPLLTCTNSEGTLKSFSILSGQQKFEISAQESSSHFLCMDYDSDYSSMAVGDSQGNIFLYDSLTQKLVNQFCKASWFSNGHFNRVIRFLFAIIII